ncbi:MAG: pantoate--beta-alanine ligase [Alphaproteobacteria bacterium]|nr:pantoate--beta-alanine ligase [Alphaproteobacteria bacterium]
MPDQINAYTQLQTMLHSWRVKRQTVALVPTMGALHQGHLELVREAKKHAQAVVVSIFVNPTQFGPKEDFSKYPRMLEKDIALLAEEGIDLVWAPSVQEMYPEGFATLIHVSEVSEGLCGAIRPGHFNGVATVVMKLFNQIKPDVALFGEKDYQQLCVIRRLVTDLNVEIEIIGVPTVREKDGLAMSSRNQYLSAEERKIAPILHKTLVETAKAIAQGDAIDATLEEAKHQLHVAGFHKVDYLELREEETLVPLAQYGVPARLLLAAHLGTTRLIDNVRVL